MGAASKVMYTIANIFNWIIAITAIACIVLTALAMANILPPEVDRTFLTQGYLVYYIILLIVSIVAICLVRIAKRNGTSKAWDVFFIVVGVLEFNIFYILGGAFGLVARK